MTLCTTLYLDFCIWLPPTVLSQKAVARMERLNTSVLEEYKTFAWQTRNAWSWWSNGKNSSTQILCRCDKFLLLRYGKIPNENQEITPLFKAYLVCRLSEISPCFLFTISTLEQKHWWQNILLKALLTSISLGKFTALHACISLSSKMSLFHKKTFDLTRFDLWHWNSSKCTSTYISHLFCNYFPFILKGFPRLTLHRQNWTSSELVTSLATPAVLTVLGYIKGALLEAWTTEGQATASFQKASFGLTSFS